MNKCEFCEIKDCSLRPNDERIAVVDCPYYVNSKPTNADRIRAMTDEELANVLTDFSNNGGWITETGRQICYEQNFDWLQQPCGGADHE